MKCCHITSPPSMCHSAILDTTLHKSIFKVMLKIISVRHYKKQPVIVVVVILTLAIWSITKYYDEPRTLEMSLQRTGGPKCKTLQKFFSSHINSFPWVHFFISFFLYFSTLWNVVIVHQRHLCVIQRYWTQDFINLYCILC